MTQPIVYLAGPINGCDEAGATYWRHEMIEYFKERGIRALSPMRAKEDLWRTTKRVGPVESYEHLGPFFTTRGIMARDFSDVKRSDLLLVNLLEEVPGTPSVGTCMELAWAYAMQKPVVVAVGEDSRYGQHPLVCEAMGGLQFDDLLDAAHAAVVVLNG